MIKFIMGVYAINGVCTASLPVYVKFSQITQCNQLLFKWAIQLVLDIPVCTQIIKYHFRF